MAELILTPTEQEAALWSDLDDAALGKLVKKKMAGLTSSAEQLDRATIFAAAMLLCCVAVEVNAETLSLDIDGLSREGRDFGDWMVVAKKKNNSASCSECGADLEPSLH